MSPIILTVAVNLTCHEECTSRTNCWGPEDHQCDINGCRNFKYKNRCVLDCSDSSLPMSEESSGVFQNEETKICEICHPECIGGCQNGTVSSKLSYTDFHEVKWKALVLLSEFPAQVYQLHNNVGYINCLCLSFLWPIINLGKSNQDIYFEHCEKGH